jgi:hypothetical protein
VKAAQLSDYQLKSCNKWVLPTGTKLAIPHTIPFFQYILSGAVLSDLELATPAQADFLCKVVSSTGVTPGTLVQIQWPDGRYLSNPGVDFFSFVGTGRRGRLVSPYKLCPKSSKIRINLDNSVAIGGSAPPNANMEIYFEGVLLVDLI